MEDPLVLGLHELYLAHIDHQQMLYYDVPFIASPHIHGHRIFNLDLKLELSKLFYNQTASMEDPLVLGLHALYRIHIDHQKMLYYDVPFIASHHIHRYTEFNLDLMLELSKLFYKQTASIQDPLVLGLNALYPTDIDHQKMLYYDVPFMASHHIHG